MTLAALTGSIGLDSAFAVSLRAGDEVGAAWGTIRSAMFITRIALAGWLSVTLAACSGGVGPPSGDPSTAPPPIVREILAQALDLPGAPGQRFSLVRYTIAPGAQLPAHVHPGVQMGAIVSGTLSYRVVSGTAVIHRSVGADGAASRVETVIGPADTTLHPGDALIEPATMVHLGANETDAPLVIVAALLTDPDLDLAVPVPGDPVE